MSDTLGECLAYVAAHPVECHAEVTRAGIVQPCDQYPVGVLVDDTGFWPACEFHLRQNNGGAVAVHLDLIIAAADRR